MMLRRLVGMCASVAGLLVLACGGAESAHEGPAGDRDIGVRGGIDYSYLETTTSVEMVHCGEIPRLGLEGETVIEPEEYNFGLMNAEMKVNPHLAERANLEQVASCEDARRYTLARRAFMDELANPVESSEASSGVRRTVAEIMGGSKVTGKRGVVEISTGCTGWLLNRRVVVTSAHCLPRRGVRANANFVIQHFHPTRGKEVIGSGEMEYFGRPEWQGSGSVDFDIGYIKNNRQDWSNTITSDYLAVYQDFASRIQRIRTWGRGFDSMSGTGLGELENRNFDVNSYSYEHFWTTAGEQRRLCRGDSGGPVIREVNGRDLVTATNTGAQVASSSDLCARKGGRQYHTRTQWNNLRWIAEQSRSQCTLQAADGFEFRTCLTVQ